MLTFTAECGQGNRLIQVTADQLKKHVSSGDFKNAIPKYPGKNRAHGNRIFVME